MSARRVDAGRREDIERLLVDRGFSWEYHPRLSLDRFDDERSLHNQARLGHPINADIVTRYRGNLARGDIFPAIIAANTGSSTGLLRIDGNHRFKAYEAIGRKGIDTYVIVGASMQAITLLTFEANAKHGLPTTDSERIRQGLWMKDNGMTVREAAGRLGVSETMLNNASKVVDAGRRADEAHILRTDWDRLPDATMIRLGQLTTDEGFADLTRLVLAAKLTSGEVARFVTDMQRLHSSRKQVEYVRALRVEFADRLQTGGLSNAQPHGRQKRTPRQQLALTLGQVGSLPAPETIVTFFTEADRTEFGARVRAAIATLEGIRKVLVP